MYAPVLLPEFSIQNSLNLLFSMSKLKLKYRNSILRSSVESCVKELCTGRLEEIVARRSPPEVMNCFDPIYLLTIASA